MIVLIPAHNEAASIRETISSLGRPTRPPDEIIVVSDNSSDATDDRSMLHGARSWSPDAIARCGRVRVYPAAASASATSLAAAACGLGDRKGRLWAGYNADLLVVDGDPVADIGALVRPAAVFAGGRRPGAAA